MMARDSNGNPLTWQFLAVIGSIVIAVTGGSVWLGSLSNQIAVNTIRLARIEDLLGEIREHDSNTSARLPAIEERLNKLEHWQRSVNQSK